MTHAFKVASCERALLKSTRFLQKEGGADTFPCTALVTQDNDDVTRKLMEEYKKRGNVNTKKTEYLTNVLENEEKFKIIIGDIKKVNKCKYLGSI